MQIDKENKLRHLHEYSFWQAIDDYNREVKGTNDGRTVIRTSEARVFREKLDGALADEKTNIHESGFGAFVKSSNAVLEGRMGELPFPDGSGAGSKVRKYYANYMSMTGIDPESTELDGEGRYLPISPYDPRFSDRKVMRDLGSNLGGIAVRDIYNANDMNDFAKGQGIEIKPNLKPRPVNGVSVWSAYDTGAPLTQPDDISGITVLMPYMTEKEYQTVAPWVNSAVDLSDLTEETLATRRNDMRKSVAILEGLSDMGREYSIDMDVHPGQIRAKIAGTKTNVRLTEKPDSTAYIGVVYDNGARVRYSTTRPIADGRQSELHYATPEQSLELVRFALGERLNRWDDPSKMVGEQEPMIRKKDGRSIYFNGTYHTGNGMTTVVGPYVAKDKNQVNSEQDYKNVTRIVVNTSNRTVDTTPMNDVIEAETYLRGAVDRSRQSYQSALDVDRLISEADSIRSLNDPDLLDTYTPNYDGDPAIAAIQEQYWDVLVGRRVTLLKPDQEGFDDTVGDVGELQNDSLEGEISTARTLSYDYNTLSPIDIVKAHSQDSVDHVIGQYDIANDGKRFDPVGVAAWDMSEYGVYRNNADIVKALRILDVNADELRGESFYNNAVKDQLIKFNPDTAIPMSTHTDPFINRMYEEVRDSLRSNGAEFEEDNILIDENGIIDYKISVATHESRFDNKRQKRPQLEVEGQIGQIFIPDETGVVKTQFAGSDNYAFVPGYEATIIPQKNGENKSVEERTLLKGYEQTMRQNIRYRLRQDILDVTRGQEIGSPTSVNDTYRRLHDHRYSLDFEREYLEQGMPKDVLDDMIRTQASRVRYSNEVRDGSTMFAASNAEMRGDYDYANDNTGDTFVLTGGRNMAVLTEDADGYFDPIATTSTSTNQGILRFLTTDAKVSPEGRIIPGDKNGRTALMKNDISKYMEFNPFDRQAMTLSNLLQSNAVTEPVMVGQMTFGGWTQDDAIVVSKNFADSYPMRNKDGQLRSLTIGDKLSDPNGNKGVISLVVDPDMPEDDAKGLHIKEQVEWFKKNPTMDVVMAPFPAVSRFNGGTFREMTTNHAPLVDLEGNVTEGGLGAMRMIITDKSVEAKTQAYDDEQIQMGKGRRASGQFAWALNAKDCPAIMSECYSGNSGVASNVRELLITTGLDMSETGELRRGYAPHGDEERHVIELPTTLAYRPQGKSMRLDMKAMVEEFREEVSRKGGLLELPFPLKYPTGDDIPPLNDGKTDVVYKKEEWERKGYTRKDGTYVRPTIVKRSSNLLEGKTGDDVTWGLPVMSSYLRSGQSFDDGTSSVHDYTNQYISVFKSAILYKDAERWLKDGDLDPVDRLKYEQTMERAQIEAQTAYDRITGDVKTRAFEGKHNVFRDEVMSRRMPNSATVVWTPDPRLDVDEVALGPKVAEVVGIDPAIVEPQHVLVWRDPILRDSGVRYMKCVVDPDITGAAVNPNMASSFDGDFDGDTVAIVNLQTKAARKEAMDRFSVEANLLNTGYKTTVVDPRTKEEVSVYPLAMNDGLDVQVARHYNSNLDDQWAIMTVDANTIEEDVRKGELSSDDAMKRRRELTEKISDYYKVSEQFASGRAIIASDTVEHHVESVWDACIETGAKGSPGKVAGYLKYAGIDGVDVENGLDLTNVKDAGKTLATRAENQGVMVATAVKSFGTGVAGSVSQRGVRAMRNSCCKAVLELTYPVTQAVLQSKHDPVDAIHKYGLLMGPVRQLWRGNELSRNEKGQWQVAKDQMGKPYPADKKAWKESFVDFYTSPDGLNVKINPEYVDEVTNAMSTEEGEMLSVEAMDDGKVTTGSIMDRMAYGGNYETLVEAADRGENLYDGTYNNQFAPRVIKMNQRTVERAPEQDVSKDLRGFAKSDTVAEPKRTVSAKSAKVSTSIDTTKPVGLRRGLNVDVESIENNGLQDDHDGMGL